MEKIKYVSVVFIFSLLLTGCMFSQGLERTKTDKWERRTYPKLGISVEMPKAVTVIRFRYGDPADVYDHASIMFYMHPSWYGYVEPHYVLTFLIYVLNKEQAEKYISKGGGYIASPFASPTFHSELKENFQIKNAPDEHYYRRDFRNEATGDVVLATAKYWVIVDPNAKLNKEEDVATIRRILNSVQFIAKEEPKQNPDKTANDTENKK